MAEVAYGIQRYEDCLKYLTPLMKNSFDVDIKKLKMWSNCHKHIINKKRYAWLMISTQKYNADINTIDKLILNEYKLSVSSDIKRTCNRIIQFIDDQLMDIVLNVNHKILVYQICGDCHRYKAEVCVGETMSDNYYEALGEYKSGWELCLYNTANSYIILSFAFKYAICLNHINGSGSAIQLIEEALNITNPKYDSENEHMNMIIYHITKFKQTLSLKSRNKLLIMDVKN